MAISVKAYYGKPGQGDIRRFVLTPPVSYSLVTERLAADVKKPFSLFWIDSDGDLISLASEEDLKVATSTVDKGQLLRVVVKEGSQSRRYKCVKSTDKTPEADCPRRQARQRLQHTLPLLFPTDLLGSLLGFSSPDPLDGLLGHDSSLSDFIKLWNAVALVSKEQQDKLPRRCGQAESTATTSKTMEKGDACKSATDEEGIPGDVDEATTVTEAVVKSEGLTVEKEDEEEEEPLVVDIRGHGVDEVDEIKEHGEEVDSKPVVEEKEEANDITRYIVDKVENEQGDDGAKNAQLLHSSLEKMEKMGFKDEGGWLSQLLRTKNGDVDKTLETLRTVHSALQSSAN